MPPLLLLCFGLFMAPVCVWQTLTSQNKPCAAAAQGSCPHLLGMD